MLSKNQAKLFKQLKQKKHRDSEGLFLLEGIKMVNEALKHHNDLIKYVICTNEGAGLITGANKKVILITDYETLSRISTLKTPQQAIAIASQKKLNIPPLPIVNEIVLTLDDIKDPGNMGTIVRLADWFGIKSIVCSKDTVDCYNPKVVQASMGAIFRVDVYYTELSAYLQKAKNKKVNILAATLEGSNIYQSRLSLPSILIMGNESVGINKGLYSLISQQIGIPNFSMNATKTESLNVSIATSVILSELRRQQFTQNEN